MEKETPFSLLGLRAGLSLGEAYLDGFVDSLGLIDCIKGIYLLKNNGESSVDLKLKFETNPKIRNEIQDALDDINKKEAIDSIKKNVSKRGIP